MKYFLIAVISLSFSVGASAQTQGKKVSSPNSTAANQTAKSSPAYAEILLEKTELESQLEDLLVGFTDDFPKVKELRFHIGLLQKQADKLLALAEANKLTLALGKLIVRKIELETALWSLKAQYNDDFPEVKRAKRKVEVFEKAIGEILP